MDSTQAPTKSDATAKKGAKAKNPRAPKGGKTAKAAKAGKPAKAPPTTKADEIIEALKAASRDKDIDFSRLVAALEEAIATAARKVYKVREMAARFDPVAGTLTAWTPYRIVEQKTKVEAPAAAEIDPDDIPLGQAAPPPPVAAETEPEKEIRLPYIELLPEEAPALLAGELAGQSWQIVRTPEGEGGPRGDPRARADRRSATRSASTARRRGSGASRPRARSRCSTRRSARPSATTSTTSTSRRSGS